MGKYKFETKMIPKNQFNGGGSLDYLVPNNSSSTGIQPSTWSHKEGKAKVDAFLSQYKKFLSSVSGMDHFSLPNQQRVFRSEQEFNDYTRKVNAKSKEIYSKYSNDKREKFRLDRLGSAGFTPDNLPGGQPSGTANPAVVQPANPFAPTPGATTPAVLNPAAEFSQPIATGPVAGSESGTRQTARGKFTPVITPVTNTAVPPPVTTKAPKPAVPPVTNTTVPMAPAAPGAVPTTSTVDPNNPFAGIPTGGFPATKPFVYKPVGQQLQEKVGATPMGNSTGVAGPAGTTAAGGPAPLKDINNPYAKLFDRYATGRGEGITMENASKDSDLKKEFWHNKVKAKAGEYGQDGSFKLVDRGNKFKMKYVDPTPGELNMQPGMGKASRFRDFVGGVASAMDNEILRRREEKQRLQRQADPNATEQRKDGHIGNQQYATPKRQPTAADSLKLNQDAALLQYFLEAEGNASPLKGPRPVSKNEFDWKNFLKNADPYKQKHAVPIVNRILKLSEETGIQPAGHYQPEIPSPYFKPPVNGANSFLNTINELDARKELPRTKTSSSAHQGGDINWLKKNQHGNPFQGGDGGNFTEGLPQEEGQDSASNQNPNADTLELPTIDGLPPEQQDQAGVAFEEGEILKDPNTGAIIELDKDLPNNHRHDAKGKKHALLPEEYANAEALESGSRLRSTKRTKTQAFDKALQIPKAEGQQIADMFNLGVKIKKKTSSHAELFQQINDGLLKQRKMMSKYVMDVNTARQSMKRSKADSPRHSSNRNTNSSRSDKYSQDTMRLNKENYDKLPTEQDIFDTVYQRQESMKEAISRRIAPNQAPWDDPSQNQIEAPDSNMRMAQYNPPNYGGYAYPKTTRRSTAERAGLLSPEQLGMVTSGEWIVPDMAGDDLAGYYKDLQTRSKTTADEYSRSFQDVQPFSAGGGNVYGDVAKLYNDGKKRPVIGQPFDPEDPLNTIYRKNHEWAYNLNKDFNPHDPEQLKWFQKTHKQYIGDYFGDKQIDGAFGHQTRMAPLLRVRTNDPKQHLTKDLTRPYIYYYDQKAPDTKEKAIEEAEKEQDVVDDTKKIAAPAAASDTGSDDFPAYDPMADASSLLAMMEGRAPVRYAKKQVILPVQQSEDPTSAYQAALAATNLAGKNLMPSQVGANAALQAQGIDGLNAVNNSYRQANNTHLTNYLNQLAGAQNMQSEADVQAINMQNDLTAKSKGVYSDRMVQLIDNLASNRMDYKTFIANLKIMRNMSPAANVQGGYSGHKYNFTPGATIPTGSVTSGVTTKYNPKTKTEDYYRNGRKMTEAQTKEYIEKNA